MGMRFLLLCRDAAGVFYSPSRLGCIFICVHVCVCLCVVSVIRRTLKKSNSDFVDLRMIQIAENILKIVLGNFGNWSKSFGGILQ